MLLVPSTIFLDLGAGAIFNRRCLRARLAWCCPIIGLLGDRVNSFACRSRTRRRRRMKHEIAGDENRGGFWDRITP
jgi:hypothetical protein